MHCALIMLDRVAQCSSGCSSARMKCVVHTSCAYMAWHGCSGTRADSKAACRPLMCYLQLSPTLRWLP